MKKQVWFWQLIVSPHMVYLAQKLASKGVEVHFVARNKISTHRKKLGWVIEEIKDIQIHILEDDEDFHKLLNLSDKDAIHICQGLRNNGYIGNLLKIFNINKQKFWVILETIDPRGVRGGLRKIIYRYIYYKYKKNIMGFLTIGYKLPAWLKDIGVSKNIIYPFSYFLNESKIINNLKDENKVRFIFVGNFIPRKQPDIIFKAINSLDQKQKKDCEIWMLGSGIMEDSLKKYLVNKNINVKWLGVVNIKGVRKYISESDYLLLPSNHDGWGAVVSEALIEGTPVICTNSCGSAGIVKASGYGATFEYNDLKTFTEILKKVINEGQFDREERKKLKEWAFDLTVDFGADYLYSLLFLEANKLKPKWIELS